jgi:hypothetical protein
MKRSEFFAMASLVFLSPHMTKEIATIVGGLLAVFAIVISIIDLVKPKNETNHHRIEH